MITFDGHDFSTLFSCGDPEISLFTVTPNLVDVTEKDGRIVTGSALSGTTITFTIFAEGDAIERRRKFSELGRWLNVDEPKPLVIPDINDWYYLAVPDGSLDLTRCFNAEYTTITFQIVETAAYGNERTFTIPSGSSVTFTVSGTYPTKPTISADSAVRNGTSLVWGIKLDDADFVHVPISVSTAVPVSIDCDRRTASANSANAMITLGSDWLELEPGEHTLTMDKGTGAATVTYRERWL